MAPGNTHVAVIGAGIVGLAVAFHLRRMGAAVTLIDRDFEGDKASFGNAAAIAVTNVIPASTPDIAWRALGWVLDPLGPLPARPAPRLLPWLMEFAKAGTAAEVARISAALAALNACVYDDLVPMLQQTGLDSELRRRGALTVYESEAGFAAEAPDWARRRALGIIAEDLTAAEAREREPDLGPLVHRAVFTPQWSNVRDPKRLVLGLQAWLRGNGVAFQPGEARDISARTVTLADGTIIKSDRIVVAAGVWSQGLAQQLGDRVLLESERGYAMTVPSPGVTLNAQVIFAEHKFVATPLSCGLRIGGAAEFGGLEAPPNFVRSRALVKLATRYLPRLRSDGGSCWAGHRPATPDSLPVIGPARAHASVFYAFGHGHLGLTQAATTGRLVGQMLFAQPTGMDMAPYSIQRFN